MEDPFILEARKHKTEADRNGALAFRTFAAAVVSFSIFCWNIDNEGWWWILWWLSVGCSVRMLFALEARWFHRRAIGIALEFHAYSKRSQ